MSAADSYERAGRPEEGPRPRTGRRTEPLALAAVAVVVVALAILEVSVLDRRPLANDEATSYFIAHVDWGAFWESLVTSEANGSAFYLSLRFWLNVGRSEAVLRVLPLLFALATLPVLFATARRMFGSFVGVVAAALLASNFMFVEHAQDLRSYSLSALLVTTSSWFFVRGLDDPSTSNRIGYVVASALALYAHFFSALVLVAQVGAGLLFPDRRRSVRFLGPNLVAVGLLGSPLAAFVLAGDRGQVDWIPELTAPGVRSALLDLSGMPSTTALIVLAALVVAGISLAFLRHPPEASPESATDATAFYAPVWRIAFPLLWFVLPIAGALVISFFKPLFISRYLLVALPGLALLTAVAVASLPRRPVIAIATGVVLIAAAAGVYEWYSVSPDEGYAGKASYVASRAEADDAIAFYAPTVIRPFGYYAGYYDDEEKTISPEVLYPDLLWLGYSRTRYTPPLERIGSEAGEYERVWLITGASRDAPRVAERRELVDELARTCTTMTQPLVGVRLFSGCNS